jgi:hypothetical protein
VIDKYFDIDQLKNKPSENCGHVSLCEKYITTHEYKVESLKQIVYPPLPGEIFFIWTDNSFNAFTFIPWCLRQFKKIDRLLLSTYSINSRIVDSFIRYIDKQLIDDVTMLISESMQYRMPRVVDNLNSLVLQRNNIHVKFSWNHSKITLMQCADNYFVVEGSGNWSENSRNEQYIFLNNKSVFDFRKNCIDGVK